MIFLCVLKVLLILAITEITWCNISSTSEPDECDCKLEMKERGYIPKYAKGVKTTEVAVSYADSEPLKCGDTASFGETLGAPTIRFELSSKCKNATIIMFEPSEGQDTRLRWLVHNVSAEALRKGFSNGGTIMDQIVGKKDGDVKACYTIPERSTTNATSQNIVIIFLYCQCQYISAPTPLDMKKRRDFDVKNYAKECGLKCPLVAFYHKITPTGQPLAEQSTVS